MQKSYKNTLLVVLIFTEKEKLYFGFLAVKDMLFSASSGEVAAKTITPFAHSAINPFKDIVAFAQSIEVKLINICEDEEPLLMTLH